MQTQSDTKCPDTPHDLEAFNSYPALAGWNVDWHLIEGVSVVDHPPLPPMPKLYDSSHFCQSWCKCCEDNLARKFKEEKQKEKQKEIAYQRLVAVQLLALGVPELGLGPRQ
jgi:hypothetical protein